jgi:hypothetical protein
MTRRIKQFIIAVSIMMIAAVSVGGPLDRMPDARTNPAVDDMLRIPGVIGQTKTEACMILQQAGLNPVIHIVTGESTKHKGMECQVVKQSPLPGGVAMIGSSVEIDVYAPHDCVDQVENDAFEEEIPDDETQWSEDEEYNWDPDSSMEDDPEYGDQTGGLMQEEGGALQQAEQQSLQPAQQKKKIEWEPFQQPSAQQPSPAAPRTGNPEDRNAAPGSALKRTQPIKGE